MEREGAIPSLHERIVGAVERAGQAQDQSCALIERQLALANELHETLDDVEHGRIAAREAREGRARGLTWRSETDIRMPGSARRRGSEYRQWRRALSPSGPQRAAGHPRSARAASATTSGSCAATSVATPARATS